MPAYSESSGFADPHPTQPLVVLKFGGSSLGDADVLQRVAELVVRRSRSERLVVVVSAAAGITDLLVQAFDTVSVEPDSIEGWVERIGTRYRALAWPVLQSGARRRYEVFISVHQAALERALEASAWAGAGARERDQVLAVGERLMAPLAALLIEQQGAATTTVDAASLIRTDATYGRASVDRAVTYRQLRAWYQDLSERMTPVLTGFIGSTESGATTTLGRGGTDYTASLVAGALDAGRLERWSDTDGLYTADPRRDHGAEPIDYLALERAADWNRAGGLGMHERTLDPLVEAAIPLHVRSIFYPGHAGTVLTPDCQRLAS